jgi:hypothetical protein
VGVSAPDRIRYDHARNLIVEDCVKRDVDGVLWCDSDSVSAPDGFVRLIDGALHRNLDFVTGLYRKREGYANGHKL